MVREPLRCIGALRRRVRMRTTVWRVWRVEFGVYARDERDEDTQVSRVAIVRIRRIRSHVCSMGDNDDACAR